MTSFKKSIVTVILVFYSAFASSGEYVNITPLDSSPKEDSTSLICGDLRYNNKKGDIALVKQQLAGNYLGYYLDAVGADNNFLKTYNLSRISIGRNNLLESLYGNRWDYEDLNYYDWTNSKLRLKVYGFKSSQLNAENLTPFSIGLLKSNESDLKNNAFFTGEMVASRFGQGYPLGRDTSGQLLRFNASANNNADAFLRIATKSGDKIIIKIKANRWDLFLGLDHLMDLKLIKQLNEAVGDLSADVKSIAAAFECRGGLIIAKTAIYLPNEKTVFITERELPAQPYFRNNQIQKPEERSLFNFRNRSGAIELRPKGGEL
jgi:hypothetical protein